MEDQDQPIIMDQPPLYEDTNTAISPSISTATNKSPRGRGKRLQMKETRVQKFADIEPAIKEWLYGQDTIFKLAEEKTGLDRELVGFLYIRYRAKS